MATHICATCREACFKAAFVNPSEHQRYNDDDHHFVIIAKGNIIEGVTAEV